MIELKYYYIDEITGKIDENFEDINTFKSEENLNKWLEDNKDGIKIISKKYI
ncbi:MULTISPECIES: hypothetical protein [unclassified Clostridium]|uniref:hypothetical protein n=1 Tax=unclassified Clostridium TaxID=2614128 RepID=UPI00207A62EE|nr:MULTISPECIES: hypothetical protein [unclassified Clostridium]